MKTYTVDGVTRIFWSLEIEANSPGEAMDKAEEFWMHNTTAEVVEPTAAYSEDEQ